MRETVYPGSVAGTVHIPGSKSHTIRALLIAALAEGESELLSPLFSRDTEACIEAVRAFGAQVHREADRITVRGVGGVPAVPEGVIDVQNSGTTLFLTTAVAALAEGTVCFDGDHSIRRRSGEPLLATLRELGATVEERGEPGCAPYCVSGPIRGGNTAISCRTSQYLSSLLIALPLASGDSEIAVPLLFERPYVEMTLSWLDRQGIRYERLGYERFTVPGGQRYSPFSLPIPGDFSSATFFFVLPAVTGGALEITGLDLSDPQGDKEVLSILELMGCTVHRGDRAIRVEGPAPRRSGGPGLKGGTFDISNMPDALPALSVAATGACEPVRLTNVAHARLKETDRIAVMAQELGKMGAEVVELEDGLEILPSFLRAATVDAHEDHRIAMSLAVAALAAQGDDPLVIEGAECADVTFPGFFRLLESVRRR
ncbi:MAG: 3-phosphoshikimate 1-carboxyvinyltransferase [Spirochaetaceae bacterium]